jgi:hypothetical protein
MLVSAVQVRRVHQELQEETLLAVLADLSVLVDLLVLVHPLFSSG